MKAKLHFPTETYGFAEIELDVESIEEALDFYNVSKTSYDASTEGLGVKEWNNILDGYRSVGTMPSDAHERMNKAQRWLIHELDKSDTRLAPKKELRDRNKE